MFYFDYPRHPYFHIIAAWFDPAKSSLLNLDTILATTKPSPGPIVTRICVHEAPANQKRILRKLFSHMKVPYYLLFCLVFSCLFSDHTCSRSSPASGSRAGKPSPRAKRAATICDGLLAQLSSPDNDLDEVVVLLERVPWKSCMTPLLRRIVEDVCSRFDAQQIRAKLSDHSQKFFDDYRPMEISTEEEEDIVIVLGEESVESSSNDIQESEEAITISSSSEDEDDLIVLPDSPPRVLHKPEPEVINLVDNDDLLPLAGYAAPASSCAFKFTPLVALREWAIAHPELIVDEALVIDEANAISETLKGLPDDQLIQVPLLAKYKTTNSKLDASSLKRLLLNQGNGWLKDDMINSYGRLKASHRGQDGIQYYHIDSLVINAQTFPNHDMPPGVYFWPLADGSHWSLLIMEITDQKHNPVFKYFDSFYELADREAFFTNSVLPKLRTRFPNVKFSDIKSLVQTLKVSEDVKQKVAKNLKQSNDRDCGVYVSEVINRIVFKLDLLARVNPEYIRKRMAVEILQVIQLI